MSLKLASRAFNNGDSIPDRYTCRGDDTSPPLSWIGVPSAAKELVLIMDDPDAPSGTYVHWVLYNIQPSQAELDEGVSSAAERLSNGMLQGLNGEGKTGYTGPCPPSGRHQYYFHLYALDSVLNLPPAETREQVDRAMKGHILEEAELLGYYARK